MCNVMRCRLLVVLTVLLLLTRWGGDRANRAHATDSGVEAGSFGTLAVAHALGGGAPIRGASWLHGASDPAGRGSFGTFEPLREERRQPQRAASSGEWEFVRHFLAKWGAAARLHWFDSS